MKVMHSEWKDRVKHWMRTLKDDLYQPLGEISWEAFPTMEYLTSEEALKGPFQPVSPGFTWGHEWEYCWFKGSIALPEEAKGQRIVMDLKPQGESALFVNGKSFGTYRASWVNEPHHFMEDNVLSFCAQGGEHYDILMETYAGHFMPEAPTGGCTTGPVLPGAFEDTAEEGKRRVLGKCTYGIWNEDAYQLYMDVATLSALLTTLDETSLRAAKIAKALQEFTLIADFEQPREGRIASYKAAREALRPVMEAKNGSSAPVFYAVGNAHLDLAWLWPMAETYRKTERTFAAQLRLIEEYPEYKFIQSQPASYEMCKKYYPELFARIKEAVKGGCDVVVADGFTGNVVLKLTEGMGKMFSQELKGMFLSSLLTKLGAVLLSGQIRAFKKRMDASEVGGALLLGIRCPVIKAHGNSDGRAFLNAIRQAALCCQNDVVGKISQRLAAITSGGEE